MRKLSKGLAVVAAGAPAAAVVTVCGVSAVGAGAEQPPPNPAAASFRPVSEAAEPPARADGAAMIGPGAERPEPAAKPRKPAAKPRKPETPEPGTAARAKIISFAKAQLGTPYYYGGTCKAAKRYGSASNCDCSSLAQQAYAAAGFTLPRTSQQQFAFGVRIAAGTERPGDLVYFSMRASGPTHMGIVQDPAKGMMIVAPRTGDVVKMQSYRRYPGGPKAFTRPFARADFRVKLAELTRS
ncbi:C40 family peptidase [Actinomadura sp. 6N118]|uniref:C40 family peptidase n=1 Tax=Actinomadura sp. 6N118 TaxID=3375151 RepID=UPI00379264C7